MNGEYTAREIGTLFGLKKPEAIYPVLDLFKDVFPTPTAPRLVNGNRIPARFYPAREVDAIRLRYEQSRHNGETILATFRRVYNRPPKRPFGPKVKREDSLARLEAKVDQILEIMKRLA